MIVFKACLHKKRTDFNLAGSLAPAPVGRHPAFRNECFGPLLEQRFDSNVDARDDSLAFVPREEEMRAIAFFAGVLVATPLMAAEQLIFYTANFPDATSVQLSVQGNSVSQGGDYDFEVAIGLVETDATGAIRYADTGRHRARVRCAYPAYVGVGTRRYPIEMPLSRSARDDWKENLWMTFCASPSS